MVATKLNNEQKVTATLAPKTSKGKPVPVDGKPSWSVAAGDVTLEAAEDGMSCTIISGDSPGVSQVVVEADADLGEGVVTISDVIEVTVEGALASNLGLTVGTPVDK